MLRTKINIMLKCLQHYILHSSTVWFSDILAFFMQTLLSYEYLLLALEILI